MIKNILMALKPFALGFAVCIAAGLPGGNARAAIVQRGTATTAINTANTMTILKPTGVVAGDVMIASIAQRDSAGTMGAATSAGWTLIKTNGFGGSASRVGTLLYRVAGATESSSNSYTFALVGTVGGAVGDIVAFSGVDPVTPLDVAAGSLPAFTYSNALTGVSATAITIATANAAVIMFGQAVSTGTGAGAGGTWSGWTTGLTNLYDHQGIGTVNDASSVGAAWRTLPTAGSSTGVGAATLSKAMRNGALWVALRPGVTVSANATNSTVSAAPASVLADGLATSTITVTLRDASSNAVAGKTVTLASSRGASDAISAASGASDASGVVTFTVSSTTPGSSVFTATNITDSIVVTQTANVTFTASPAKDFLTFGANVIGSSATIDTNAATIAWIVPYGSTVTSLAPTYTLSALATSAPISGTSRNFTTPQTYTNTAQDLSTKVYTVTVTVAAPSTNKNMLTFDFPSGPATIVGTNISVTVPYGTAVTNLAPTYTASPLATGTPVSGTARNFTTPQTYTVTAQDFSTKAYLVTVTLAAASTNKDILTFTFPTYGAATIAGTNITLTVPAGTPVTALAPTYTVSALATGSPVSGTTRSFTTPQTYTVTAQNGSTKIYLVTVTVTAGPQTYAIAASTDLAQEFSPMNGSGHPVVTGLNNYPNSTAPKALAAGQMKAPWTAVGVQTMMCSDCHDTTSTNYIPSAAQGPHGSANPYMLRGPNAANWPVVPGNTFANSWCANCHNDGTFVDGGHTAHRSVPGCYSCHIVIPHGGKLSRLIADGNSPNMPARYAYNNDTNNVQLTGFTKAASLSESSCGAKCDSGRHALANGGQW